MHFDGARLYCVGTGVSLETGLAVGVVKIHVCCDAHT